jgi:acyl-CoA reductase-like NAD-dependent aldehyde dehydrogenase
LSDILRTVSPIDGQVIVERELAADAAISSAVARAQKAQMDWRRLPIERRQEILSRAVDAFEQDGEAIAEELTRQMGRPIAHSPGEVRGFSERARHMIAIAPAALADIEAAPMTGFRRFIRRDPLGLVFVLAPWNYPYLTSVNAIVPALLAGNAVIMKPSHQTPLSAERMAAAFAAADLPDGVFQYLYLDHGQAEALMRRPEVGFVAFTGSVQGGLAVQRALSGRFAGAGLELGGKDPAYVRADAPLEMTVENLVDGAFFNAGQSCCGIERIYVHESVFDEFLDAYTELVRGYRLGNPLEKETTIGPMARPSLANDVRVQVAAAVAAGARAHIDAAGFPMDRGEAAYLAPQVLTDVDHGMAVMREESFGPVVGIMPVGGDTEAVALMNDSDFGLTASIWTRDQEAALHLGEQLETGTVFMNRCDYLDPALAWTGVKQSGRGCTLSQVGYEQLTRPKSYHLRLAG